MAMSLGAAMALALVIILLLLVAAAVAWNSVGWTSFSYQLGDSPGWIPKAGRGGVPGDVSKLRFSKCYFSVARADGITRTLDVSPALNSMAVAYKGGKGNPSMLTLTRPLNPFSFVIPGFNDRASVSNPTAPPWCSAPPPACGADGGCPVPVAGACGPDGACFSCSGGPNVTLVGKYRTI